MDEVWLRAIGIVVCSVLGSGGLWAYLQNRDVKRNATTKLMMGIAYGQLTSLGLDFINRGSVTKDEYEDYRKYLFEPYKALGGNGVAERIMNDVSALPLRPHNQYAEIFRNPDEGLTNHVRIVTTEEHPQPPPR